MRLERDPDLAAWLSHLSFTKECFQWDRGNSGKLKKHKVTKEQVEEIFAFPFVLGGKILEPYHPESRWILFGRTMPGRKLALIFTIRDEQIRPISCRAMRRKEAKLYEESCKG